MTKSITQYIGQEAVSSNIQQVLKDKTPQFIASVASLVASNEKLKMCDNGSILQACLVASSLDLPINQNLGFAYIIPYKDNAQFQMGYKGFIQLAMRSNQFKTLNVQVVKENEIVGNNLLTGEITFNWLTENRDKAKTVGYVAYMRLTNGFEKSLFMTDDEMKTHASKYSQTFKSQNDYVKKSSKWTTDFDDMAKKTVIKLLLSKYAPMTTEMQTAQLADQAIVKGENNYEYPDNEETDRIKVAKEESKSLTMGSMKNEEN